MRQRKVFPWGPRPLDIAQFVLTASKLELEFTTATQFAARLQLDLQRAANVCGSFKVGAAETLTNAVAVKATWDSGSQLPVLWYPWRYAWDGHEFVTAHV
jgi:hypothetical protein